MSVDPGNDTQLENPQSWNKYAYVRNNPLKNIDPHGTQEVGIPTNQQQMDQVTATALVQQAEPEGRAEEAADQARALEATGEVVCEAAPVIGEGAAVATTGLLLASPAGGATLPAAGVTSGIGTAADFVAAVCKPGDPERVGNFVADLAGAGAASHTATVLEGARAGSPLLKEAFVAATEALISGALRLPLVQTLSQISDEW